MQTHWQSDKDRLLQPAPDKGLPVARPVSPVPVFHRLCLALFLLAWPAVFWLRHQQPTALWPVAALLGLACLTTIVGLCRTLPAQNVIAAAVFISVVAGAIQTIGTVTNLPFGPYVYTDDAGPCLFQTLPCVIPLIWVVVFLNCRGIARLILRPWRRAGTYGLRLMVLTCVLAVLFDLGLEPFASAASPEISEHSGAYHFWAWQTANFPHTWYGAPWLNFIGWLGTLLVIAVTATPWLINKRPVQFPPDYHPLGVWLLLNLYIAITLLLCALWLPAAVVLVLTFIITILALSYAQG